MYIAILVQYIPTTDHPLCAVTLLAGQQEGHLAKHPTWATWSDRLVGPTIASCEHHFRIPV